jgi:hypothetical protein
MAMGPKYSKADFAVQVPLTALALTEQKFLARLNRKYDQASVHRVIDIVGLSAPRGRPPRALQPGSTRSANVKTTALNAQPQVTETEKKLLARLNRKYGVAGIHDVVDKVGLSQRRGAPSKGELPRYEAMHWADWIDDVAEEYRQKGSRSPIRDAENEFYEMITEGLPIQNDERAREVWRLSTKNNKVRHGRRDVAALKKALHEHRQRTRKAAKGHI